MRLRRLEPVLRSALKGPCDLPGRGPLLVAVSGGADSTALLLGLHNLMREKRVSLVAAHLHHGLRGADADADLAFVEALCSRLRVPLIAARWNTRLRMRRRGLAGEGGLRVLRREFLARAARQTGAAAIATAHTADDQLETLLMRFARGAGLRGLAGMRPRRGRWIKPMLLATRADIEADLRRVGQEWREDRSNRDLAHARNRVRHVVVPALVEALSPGLDPARARASLARKATRGSLEIGFAASSLERWTDDVLNQLCRIQPGEIALDSMKAGSYPSTARRLFLRQLWTRIAPASPGLTHHHLEALSRLVDRSPGGARVDLAGGWIAEKEHAWIRFHRPSGSHPAPPARSTGPGRPGRISAS